MPQLNLVFLAPEAILLYLSQVDCFLKQISLKYTKSDLFLFCVLLETPIGIIATAVSRLESNQMPASLSGPTKVTPH